MITTLYMALLGVFFVVLSAHAAIGRRAAGRPLGDPGKGALQRRIRAHGNFAEYTPLFLIMLWAAEQTGMSLYAVHALGILFTIGRILHAYGLLCGEQYDEAGRLTGGLFGRVAGMVCTFLAIGLLAIILLVYYVEYALASV